MRELIVSKDVRKYLQERKHVFSDVEIATLVSNNATWSLSEKHQALRGLLKVTKDKELIRQIQERISWDTTCEKRFEDSFVNLEHPFVAGDIVRIIGTDENGVVRFCSDLERIQEIEKRTGYTTIALTK